MEGPRHGGGQGGDGGWQQGGAGKGGDEISPHKEGKHEAKSNTVRQEFLRASVCAAKKEEIRKAQQDEEKHKAKRNNPWSDQSADWCMKSRRLAASATARSNCSSTEGSSSGVNNCTQHLQQQQQRLAAAEAQLHHWRREVERERMQLAAHLAGKARLEFLGRQRSICQEAKV